MKFRFHRGGLAESLQTVVEVSTLDALADLLSDEIEHPVAVEAIKIEPYAQDRRIGWDTHIVTISGLGVMGFTDGPLSANSKPT